MYGEGPGGVPLLTYNEFRILTRIKTEPELAYGSRLNEVGGGNAFDILRKLTAAGIVRISSIEGNKHYYCMTPRGENVFAVHKTMVTEWIRLENAA